ncbi:MAG TPA: MotA/TolQ/ExbB proton channel family protein [Noviherbaspirillum sp.]|nr:MotA/TolQ/ExbB proton channel family protein [Noviherbaspirillum sp.]
MDHPYGIVSLWAQADLVIKGVAIILLIMSMMSWYVIVAKAWSLAKLRKMAAAATDRFWHTKSFEEGLRTLTPNRQENPFRALTEDGSEAAAHHAQNKDDLHGALNVSDWLTSCLRRSIDDATSNLQAGLSILASVGSTAPFVGLFGTVWGIYHALIGIGASGQASIDKVAGPVGEALIMTALGLAVAIPAVLGYNALTRGNKTVLTRLNRFAHDLHAYLITGARVGKQAPVLTLRKAGEK